MAELPRYQPTGYLPADVPRLDFANLKESVAMTQGINSALDRLSGFAFKEAAERAQREGAQYGVENPPTMEQILKAKEQGKSLEELLAKPGTYFGDAARKAQAQQVRIDFEAVARQNLETVNAKIDSGTYTLDQIQTEIKAITTNNGSYRKVLASVDAEEAMKFSASIASAGHQVYKKAIEQQIKLDGIKNEREAEQSLNAYSTSIKNILSQEKDPILLKESIENEKVQFTRKVYKSNRPEFITKKMDELDSKVYTNIAEHLLDPSVSKNPTEALIKIQSGNVGNLSELYKTLDKDKLGAAALKVMTDRRASLAAAKDIEKLGNEEKVTDLLIEYHDPKTTGARKKAIGLEMVKSRVLSIEQIEKFLNPNLANGDSAVFYDISYQVKTGVITNLNDLRKTAARAGINGAQLGELSKQFIARTEKDEGEAAILLRRNSGLPDVNVGKNKANEHQFRKAEKLNSYYEEAKRAQILDTGSFNPKDVANVAIQRYDNEDKKNKQKESARNSIASVTDQLVTKKKVAKGFVIDENTSLDDLLAKKIIDEKQYNYLIGLQTELRK
jgi:hypothetical protein